MISPGRQRLDVPDSPSGERAQEEAQGAREKAQGAQEQIQAIQSSRSWKVLMALGRIKTGARGVLGRFGDGTQRRSISRARGEKRSVPKEEG
jgi:hypothetical protein